MKPTFEVDIDIGIGIRIGVAIESQVHISARDCHDLINTYRRPQWEIDLTKYELAGLAGVSQPKF